MRPSSSPSETVRGSFCGGEPSHEVPFLAFCGAEESTATNPRAGTFRPADAIPELPRKARLPIWACSRRIQPDPSS